MPTVRLTEVAVQRYKARAGERIEYFDALLPGFGLRVRGPTERFPEGTKSWILLYRHGGVKKRLTIEPGYPALKLAEARQEARSALQLLAKGEDPALAKGDGAEGQGPSPQYHRSRRGGFPGASGSQRARPALYRGDRSAV